MRHPNVLRTLIVLAAALPLTAPGCGGGPTSDDPGGGNPGGGTPTPRLASVTISPDNFSLTAGGTLQFTAAARDSAGAPFSPVTYVWGATGGAVSAGGLFTAGTTAGPASVFVTANNSVSDTTSGVINPVPASAPDTVFAENFESGSFSVWQDRGLPQNQTIVTDAALARSGQRALEINFPQGSDGGWLTRFFMPGWDTIYVSYWVKLQAGWLGGTKLVSFYGSRIDNQWSAAGKASQCPNGTDFFVATIASFPGGNPGPTAFYTYYPDMTPDNTGSCYGSTGSTATPPSSYVSPTNVSAGAWHLVEYLVVLNTPGQLNASQQFWIDGVLRGSWSGIRVRTTTDLRLNAVTITASVSGGSPQTQKMWVDDLVVLRRRP